MACPQRNEDAVRSQQQQKAWEEDTTGREDSSGEACLPHHPGYWSSTATATSGTIRSTGKLESSVAYLQAPAIKKPRDPGYLQRRQPPPGNRWDFPVPKFATAPTTKSARHASAMPEISPLKPTPPRPIPVTSPRKIQGHSRQRVVPRSLKKTFEELFGDSSDLDDWERKKKSSHTSFTGWIWAPTRCYPGTNQSAWLQTPGPRTNGPTPYHHHPPH